MHQSMLVQNKDILLAEVGIKDYGDKENSILGEKYGVKGKDDLPAVKLFIQNREQFVDFPKSSTWTVDNLRNLLRDNIAVYIGLPGCLQEYDLLAMKFIQSADKEGVLKEAEQLKPTKSNETTAKTYIQFMTKILKEGEKFVAQEKKRLGKIISEGKVNEKKKQELSNRLNVLHSFVVKTKDEL